MNLKHTDTAALLEKGSLPEKIPIDAHITNTRENADRCLTDYSVEPIQSITARLRKL
jgi:hypothetical protein